MKTRKGTDSDDTIDGSGAPEKIYGLDGNDTITGGAGGDRIWCGESTDGTLGQWDSADGGQGDDQIHGEGGADFLHGGIGLDKIFGDDGDDFLFGDNGDDIVEGGAGNDILSGDKGRDTLDGGDGNDTLMAIFGNDLMKGGAGDDLYFTGRDKADTVDTSGNDTYHIENGDASPTILDKTGSDKIVFEEFNADQLTFTREGYDLQIKIDGFHGKITVSSFFHGSNSRIETLLDNSDDHTSGYSMSGLSELKTSGESIDGATLWDLS